MILPCKKYFNNTPMEQIKHIKEEIEEIIDAYNKYDLSPTEENRRHVSEEIVDARTALSTLEEILRFSGKYIGETEDLVYDKNMVRGYYD